MSLLQDSAALLLGLLLLFQPWGAWSAVEVNMEDKVEVFQGKTAQITCLFRSDDGIGAMIMQWFYVTRSSDKQRIYYQDATMQIVDRGTPYTDRISVNGSAVSGEVVMTIENVQLKDETDFICLIKSLTDGIDEGRTSLKVFVTPQLPTIEAVESGISVTDTELSKIGTCEVKNGYPKPNITWYRNHMPLRNQADIKMVSSITTESSGLFSVTSELRMTVVKEDKDAQFYCEVTYLLPGGTGMTETSNISVTVYYPHEEMNIWVASPSGKMKEGDTMEIQCSGDGNSPSSLITISHEESGSSWETDKLVLNNVTRLNNGVYICRATDMETFEDVSQNISVFIHYLDDVVIEPGKILEVPQGAQLKATCNALASLQTNTVWLKDGEMVSEGHILIVDDVTFDSSGTYECVVTVPEIEGMKTSGSLEAHVEGPPEITEQDLEIESYESSVPLKCHARGYPAPQMTWTTSDGQIVDSTPTETEDGYESVFTVQFSSNITAVCRASNQLGEDTVTFTIKATTHTSTPPTPATTTITATPTTPTTTATPTSPSKTTTTTTTTTVHVSVKTETSIPPKRIQKESNGVIIAVIIICILLLAVLGSVLYFLYKKGKICGRSGKQDLTKEKSGKDNIVVEMKSDNTEEAILLGVNGEKLTPTD